MHEGHRLRMLEKLKHHPESLTEHEMLEILLFTAMPRKNTNPLAHELLNEFGSPKRLFDADMDSLMRVKGVGAQTAAFLQCIGYFMRNCKSDEKATMPKKYSVETFPDFLRRRFAEESNEAVDFYFLDGQNNILNRKIFTDGSEEHAAVDPKELTVSIAQGPTKAVIIAHNHVVGNCRPSKEDDDLTKQCEMLCSVTNVRLLDHFICAGNEIYSYYQSGKMSKIANDYHVKSILRREE